MGSFRTITKVQALNQQYVSNLQPPSSAQFPDQFAYERAQILNGEYNKQPGLMNDATNKTTHSTTTRLTNSLPTPNPTH